MKNRRIACFLAALLLLFGTISVKAEEPVPAERTAAEEIQTPEETQDPAEETAAEAAQMPEETAAAEETPSAAETQGAAETEAPDEIPGPEEAPPAETYGAEETETEEPEVQEIWEAELEIPDDAASAASPYATKRLLVFCDTMDSFYGAAEVYYMEDAGVYVLGFDTEAETAAAYEEICLRYSCMIDEVISAEEALESLTWGREGMGFDAVSAANLRFDRQVVVAVMDTGFGPTDADSLFAGRILPGANVAEDNADTTDDGILDTSSASYGHGTHVAGILAACTPDNVKILPVKIFSKNKSTAAILLKGLSYALDAGADVVNLSLGIQDPNQNKQILNTLLEKAAASGTIVCCAAGNSNTDVRTMYPANRFDTIAVSALNRAGQFASGYSNYGSRIDFAAPGTGVESTMPHGGTAAKTGTSQAAPHVSAAFALLKSMYPSDSAASLYARAAACAEDLGETGRDLYYGNGCIRVERVVEAWQKENGGSTEPSGQGEAQNGAVVRSGSFNTSFSKYTLQLQNLKITAGEKILVPVWSRENGQDDLKWNPVSVKKDGTASLTLNIGDYDSAALFYADVYRVSGNGQYHFLETHRFTVPAPSGTVRLSAQDKTKGTASVTVQNLSCPFGISGVSMPTWSGAKQEDLIWYPAARAADGSWTVTWSIADHGYNLASYTTHVYVRDTRGRRWPIGGTKADFSVRSAVSAEEVSPEKNRLGFRVDTGGRIGALSSVRIAVWSEERGQDDLKWITASYDAASKTYTAQSSAGFLRSTGKCYADVWGTKTGGGSVYLGGTTFRLSALSVTFTVADPYAGQAGRAGVLYRGTLRGIEFPAGTAKIKAAVWSKKNGQDDLVWYPVTKQSDGSYTFTVSMRNHNTTGQYYMDVYSISSAGVYHFETGYYALRV